MGGSQAGRSQHHPIRPSEREGVLPACLPAVPLVALGREVVPLELAEGALPSQPRTPHPPDDTSSQHTRYR